MRDPHWHGTTICGSQAVHVVIVGDGRVVGNTSQVDAKMSGGIGKGVSSAGRGATADASPLFERLEPARMHPGNLARACVQLANDWRTDRYLGPWKR